MEYIIYKATHQRSGRVYVGITRQDIKKRIFAHRTAPTSAIYDATRNGLMYFEVIDSAQSRQEALGKESYYIIQFNSMHPNGYNRIKSHRYVECGYYEKTHEEIQQEQKQMREERRKIKLGIVRTVPSLNMPSGSFYARYEGQPMIDRISEYQDVQCQQYVIRTETQQHGLQSTYHHALIFVAPISSFSEKHEKYYQSKIAKMGRDLDLVQTAYYTAYYYERHQEWYWGSFQLSNRPMSSFLWDWIYDDIDSRNQSYLESRTRNHCRLDFFLGCLEPPIARNVTEIMEDRFYYPITVEDYISKRK